MSKVDKALKRLCGNPKPKDFMWDELVLVVTNHGFVEQPSGGGSGRKFIHVNSGYPLSLHKRHPKPYLLAYEVVAAVKALKETGEIPNE